MARQGGTSIPYKEIGWQGFEARIRWQGWPGWRGREPKISKVATDLPCWSC